ncbi:MAG: tryptophan 2,3-dioxygenase family protein, partial [Bacteroidota bacterium]
MQQSPINDQKLTLSVNPQVNAQLAALMEKYEREGKDISCYLEKLLQEKNLDYTDYLHLDTLLTLQQPKTAQPDEVIFITYHQIVELYFSLILWELQQLTRDTERRSGEWFYEKIKRINAYLQMLIASFP